MSTLRSVVLEGRSLRSLTGPYRGISPQGVGRRLRRALQRFVSRPRQVAWPAGPLVLLIDGGWFSFARRPWVLYLMALKPCDGNRAVFLDPILLPGREELERWREALATMPGDLAQRICALISDDRRGIVAFAAARGWVLQLCHFHLLSRLQARRGRRKRTVSNRSDREALSQLTRRVLLLPDGPELERTVAELAQLIQQSGAPARMRMTVRECLRRLPHSRAYRRHPELNLPTTTGTVEAMAHVIRDFLHRFRNVRTPNALRLWVIALIRMRPSMACTGASFQPKLVV